MPVNVTRRAKQVHPSRGWKYSLAGAINMWNKMTVEMKEEDGCDSLVYNTLAAQYLCSIVPVCNTGVATVG